MTGTRVSSSTPEHSRCLASSTTRAETSGHADCNVLDRRIARVRLASSRGKDRYVLGEGPMLRESHADGRRVEGDEMLVMMRYRFAGGAAGRQAYERFSKWTPSKGFEIKAGWTSASNDGGFLLLDVADVAVLLEFSAKFKDLNDELDITPVVELDEGVGVAMGAYAWVDSLT